MTEIEHPAAYFAARDRNIKRNANIGRQRRWFSDNPNGRRVFEFLVGVAPTAPCDKLYGYAAEAYTPEFPDVHIVEETTRREDGYVDIKERPATPDEVARRVYDQTDCHPLRKVVGDNDFLWSMRENLEEWGALTEKQTDAVVRFIEKGYERQAGRAKQEAQWALEKEAAECVPEGRVPLNGTIVKVKCVGGQYGTSWKILLKEERGFMVYGGMAKAFDDSHAKYFSEVSNTQLDEGILPTPAGLSEWLTGQRVAFTATVTPSEDDSKFGFFKRPTKAEVVA